MKKIPLNKGRFAIVDDEDYPYLSRFHWYALGGVFGVSVVRLFSVDKKTLHVPMWKFLIPSQNNKQCIHRNKDPLDNRKENLAVVSLDTKNHFSNKKKIGRYGKPTSKYKGVSFSSTYAGKKKWLSYIARDGRVFTKHHMTEKEAALEYNRRAFELYGGVAFQNKI